MNLFNTVTWHWRNGYSWTGDWGMRKLPYLSEKSSDFDEIWYTASVALHWLNNTDYMQSIAIATNTPRGDRCLLLLLDISSLCSVQATSGVFVRPSVRPSVTSGTVSRYDQGVFTKRNQIGVKLLPFNCPTNCELVSVMLHRAPLRCCWQAPYAASATPYLLVNRWLSLEPPGHCLSSSPSSFRFASK